MMSSSSAQLMSLTRRRRFIAPEIAQNAKVLVRSLFALAYSLAVLKCCPPSLPAPPKHPPDQSKGNDIIPSSRNDLILKDSLMSFDTKNIFHLLLLLSYG